jgi:hypothetical protein
MSVPILQCFADVTPTSVRWLWPGRIAMGRLTLLVGRPGEGKSFLTTDLAARVSTGRPWPDGSDASAGGDLHQRRGRSGRHAAARLDAHGADVRRTHLLSWSGGHAEGPLRRAFTLSDIDREAVSLMHRIAGCGVDPIGSTWAAGRLLPRQDVRLLLDPVPLADAYEPAVCSWPNDAERRRRPPDDLAWAVGRSP